MRSLNVSLTLTALLVLALTGCTIFGSGEQTTRTLGEAKAEIFDVEDEILALVPESAIAEMYPRKETSRVIFPCNNDTYIWPGSAEAALVTGTDIDVILDEVLALWRERDGWVVADSKEESHPRSLLLSHHNGLRVTVVGLRSNTVLSIGSFSACFALEGEYEPLGTY